jgi:hypothetical protein
MDIQTMLDNAMTARRAAEMKNSPQLTLRELILKLEAVKNKDLPIVFDDGEYKPTSIGSWRGSYEELAISYTQDGKYEGYIGDEIEHESHYGNYYKRIPTDLPENVTAHDFLEMLKTCQGKTFEGYKGGNFTMGKTTPVWVSDYGTSSGFKTTDDIYNQAVIDIKENADNVLIVTEAMNY